MAFWLYSSGSTGRPKGVVHSHGDIAVTVERYARNVLADLRRADVCYSTTKLFHAYGLGNGLSFPLSVGACAGLVKGRSVPERIFEAVGRYRPTLFFSVPALYAAMVKRARGVARSTSRSVRACVSAAEALPAAVLARWRAHHRRADPRRDRLDRDAPHLLLEHARRSGARNLRAARPRVRAAARQRARVSTSPLASRAT